jgi:hypothetical protein
VTDFVRNERAEAKPSISAPLMPAGEGCPALSSVQATTGSSAIRRWWPDQLDLRPLTRNSPRDNPLGKGFDYKAAFDSLDFAALKAELVELKTETSNRNSPLLSWSLQSRLEHRHFGIATSGVEPTDADSVWLPKGPGR